MKTFYVGIKGVIVKDGKVLLLRTNPGHEERGDRWEVAGGRIEDNESIEEALTRELQEELPNIRKIQVGGVLAAHRVHKDLHEDKSLVLIYYRVEAEFDGDPTLSDEHLQWEWADANRVEQLIQDPSQKTLLQVLETL